jgi:hypothetical protein
MPEDMPLTTLSETESHVLSKLTGSPIATTTQTFSMTNQSSVDLIVVARSSAFLTMQMLTHTPDGLQPLEVVRALPKCTSLCIVNWCYVYRERIVEATTSVKVASRSFFSFAISVNVHVALSKLNTSRQL